MATQRGAMGEYKKFCMALTNVGVPNLIAFDLVAVSPMSAISGNVAYMEYVNGGNALTNGVYQLGDVDVDYTRGQHITERAAGDGETKKFFLAMTPSDAATDLTKAKVNGVETSVTYAAGDNSITFGTAPADKAQITFAYKVASDLATVPVAELPILKAKLTNIALEAKPRRIAIYYSQLAAFQAKTDYGFNLSEGLAEQAVGQLSYEIDSEIVNMLKTAAVADETIKNFSKTQPVGVSLADHYAAFAAKIEEYKMAIYDRTKKFAPNFMVVASDIMPILSFVPGFQAATISEINGPYFAGTINGIKVFVSPMMDKGELFLGVNQGAMQASAGVYAPYMPVVPTQLLEMPDGLNQQGWATMYDAKILNADLLIAGKVDA